MQQTLDVCDMARQIKRLPPTRNFQAAIRLPGCVSLIAEIKQASPVKGNLSRNFNHLELAGSYSRHGAAAISILTETEFFGGRLSYLEEVRQACDLPLLRKDFIIDTLQLYQSRLAGADAVLLIAAVLSDHKLRQLLSLAARLNLQALVEVHTPAELERALRAGAAVIGINNRCLQTFVTDLNTTDRLLSLLNRPDITVVSASGISSREHMQFLRRRGVHAALVGEALVTAADTGCKIKELLEGGRRLTDV
ncbi:indole-3-glycerol phosphate synthase [Desulforamulus hydrothermalis Lam5 = DSM 18033]|nr:indole-3-glycerol phosphate synthase [Desulforamulus hydrothermalis Lam5 = DSM 18033]